MSGYEVTIVDLRRASRKYDALVEDLGSSKMPDSALSADRLGHNEVASWLKEVVNESRDAHKKLKIGLDRISEFLIDKAGDYERADRDSEDLMKRGQTDLDNGTFLNTWREGQTPGNVQRLPGEWTPGQAPGNVQPLTDAWPKGNS